MILEITMLSIINSAMIISVRSQKQDFQSPKLRQKIWPSSQKMLLTLLLNSLDVICVTRIAIAAIEICYGLHRLLCGGPVTIVADFGQRAEVEIGLEILVIAAVAAAAVAAAAVVVVAFAAALGGGVD